VDPDEAFSQVPYEKGYLLLRALEEAVGREAFDPYLRRYLDTYRFKALTTEEFVQFTEAQLPGALARVNADAYLHAPGIPVGAPAPRSERLEQLRALTGQLPSDAQAQAWTPAEWQLYLEWLPPSTPKHAFKELDERFHLTRSRNSEVLVAWLVAALRADYAPAVVRTEQLLGEVGRMKYLKPLYTQLAAGRKHRALARAVYERNRERYHPIARQGVEAILAKA
jgi:hypothetical protein